MRVTVLGTGTSFGVPVIGCDCPVCTSDDPRNRRTRASAHVALPSGRAFLIDASIDLRAQALTHGLRRVDAVFFTHTHSDHVGGVDDLRSFNWLQRAPVKLFSRGDILEDIARRYDYCFHPPQVGAGVPEITLHPVDRPFEFEGVQVTPIPILHGALSILGWRFDDFGYVTDASEVPESSIGLLRGVNTLILNALRHEPHPTHMSIPQALEVAQRIGAQRTFLTHLCHEVEHETVERSLPEGIRLAHDGLMFELIG